MRVTCGNSGGGGGSGGEGLLSLGGHKWQGENSSGGDRS